MRITRTQTALLIFNVAYLLVFGLLFSGRKNYEFLIYVSVVAFFVVFVAFLHLKYNFTTGLLTGLTIWGLLHMLGGFIVIDGNVLYAYELIGGVIKFDKAVHMFGFGCATLLGYYVLQQHLNAKPGWAAVSVLAVLTGMGIGALNEIIEFAAVLTIPETNVGGYQNTMWDMVSNTIGAITAVIYVGIKRTKRQKTAEQVCIDAQP
ncbi:MAG TPA: DUF2238 domain-containing protein [Sedimentisphaerales bacterium]|nr:DUF2238 domain-containing protein [Sedimentisphaerales bacterium]